MALRCRRDVRQVGSGEVIVIAIVTFSVFLSCCGRVGVSDEFVSGESNLNPAACPQGSMHQEVASESWGDGSCDGHGRIKSFLNHWLLLLQSTEGMGKSPVWGQNLVSAKLEQIRLTENIPRDAGGGRTHTSALARKTNTFSNE